MRRKGVRFYNNDELVELKRAFDLACVDLRLRRTSAALRERLGVVIFQLAAAGVRDCATLRREAVQQFRGGDMPGPTEAQTARLTAFVTRLNTPLRGRGDS